MSDKPIIFSGPMVRALLEGRKTQTRRVLKLPKTHRIDDDGIIWAWTDWGEDMMPVPYAPGDRLWVKETWRPSISAADPWHVAVLYPHNGEVKHWDWSTDADFGDWNIPKAAAKGNVTPLFMPRWASRLTLTVTDVRVQRLQEISEADAWAEGCKPDPECADDHGNPFPAEEPHPKCGFVGWDCAREWFADLWDSINGPDAWDANPWCAALTFDVHRCNIDQMERPND